MTGGQSESRHGPAHRRLRPRSAAAPCRPSSSWTSCRPPPTRRRGAARHPHGSGTARHAGPAHGLAGRAARARHRDAGLHHGAGSAGPAGAHRPALCGSLWRRRIAGARGRHDRVLGRVRAGFPRPVRRRRQGRPAVAWLSLLPPHPDRARPGTRHPRDRCRLALDADGRPDRRMRPARGPGRSRHRQSGQPDRHHARARPARRDRGRLRAQRHVAGLRRDLPWPDIRAARRRRRSPIPTRRSSSTASRNISP